MKTLKELRREVEARILSGECKQTIYSSYIDAHEKALVSSMLAQLPSLELRKKYAGTNGVLLGLLGVLTALKIVDTSILLLQKSPSFLPLVLLVPVVNILLIWMVAKFKPGAHMLVVIFGILSLGSLGRAFDLDLPSSVLLLNGAVLLLVVSTCLLALFLARRLLPNATVGLQPKRDANGNLLF